jgi:hypothetical protein
VQRFWAVAPWVLATLSLGAPARAGDGDLVLEKMQAALKSAHSFSVSFGPTIPMSWVVVQPDRIRRVMPFYDGRSYNGMEDWIVIGHQSYARGGDRPWKASWRSAGGIRWDEIASFLRDGTTAGILPDRTEDGAIVGVLDVLHPEVPLPNRKSIKPFHEICTYDKVTFRPRACSFVTIAAIKVTTLYENWDEPSNAVEPPPGVAAPTPPPAQ